MPMCKEFRLSIFILLTQILACFQRPRIDLYLLSGQAPAHSFAVCFGLKAPTDLFENLFGQQPVETPPTTYHEIPIPIEIK